MTIPRRIAAITAALALSAGAAQAQLINFTTSGAFTGPGCTVNLTMATYASCESIGGVILTYTFGDVQVLDSFGNAQFGTFTTQGAGPSTFDDVLFSMTINQSAPTAGASPISAAIQGEVSAIQGGLTWAPINPTTFSIGVVDYTISTDTQTGGVRIDPPGVNGVVGSPQTVRGYVSTTVPEPGSLGLLAAGLAAMAMVARRRRTA